MVNRAVIHRYKAMGLPLKEAAGVRAIQRRCGRIEGEKKVRAFKK